MSILEREILNQTKYPSVRCADVFPAPHWIKPYRDYPSRFRRKKGYTGKTAQPFNKNYKRMPKEF